MPILDEIVRWIERVRERGIAPAVQQDRGSHAPVARGEGRMPLTLKINTIYDRAILALPWTPENR